MAISEYERAGFLRFHAKDARRVRRARTTIIVLGLLNALLFCAWLWLRAFWCWDTLFCDPTRDGLYSSPACLACQADMPLLALLAASIALTAFLLFRLYKVGSNELARTVYGDLPPARPTVTRSLLLVHTSARSLGPYGPGIWTAALAIAAVVVFLLYVLSDNQSYLCLWIFDCAS